MVLGVPIPDYDPSRDEEEQLVKINGAIHEEVMRLGVETFNYKVVSGQH